MVRMGINNLSDGEKTLEHILAHVGTASWVGIGAQLLCGAIWLQHHLQGTGGQFIDQTPPICPLILAGGVPLCAIDRLVRTPEPPFPTFLHAVFGLAGVDVVTVCKVGLWPQAFWIIIWDFGTNPFYLRLAALEGCKGCGPYWVTPSRHVWHH